MEGTHSLLIDDRVGLVWRIAETQGGIPQSGIPCNHPQMRQALSVPLMAFRRSSRDVFMRTSQATDFAMRFRRFPGTPWCNSTPRDTRFQRESSPA
jgi:hypothetical protein